MWTIEEQKCGRVVMIFVCLNAGGDGVGECTLHVRSEKGLKEERRLAVLLCDLLNDSGMGKKS